MKITLTAPKPRNPLVALTRLRRAGSHRPDVASQRQRANHALRRELDRMKHRP
jgi:hypothetical protein